MNIEHVAINVGDPVALADWYVRHLGMRVVRQVDEPPFTRFIADAAGRVVLEVFHQDAPVPDYASQHHFVFHIAFVSADVAGDRARLLDAGATSVTEITHSPERDVMTFLRDPWGIVIQLVRRGRPLLEAATR
jgi:glyoxylase I family protein